MSLMPPVRTLSAYSQRSGLQLCHRDYTGGAAGAEARPMRDAEAAGMAKCSLLAALAKHVRFVPPIPHNNLPEGAAPHGEPGTVAPPECQRVDRYARRG